MSRTSLPHHGHYWINPYMDDERSRQLHELRQGAYCVAAWLAGCAAIPAIYYWIIKHGS